MKLINSDNVITELRKLRSTSADKSFMSTVLKTQSIVENEPIIDAEPVVRCLDCNYSIITPHPEIHRHCVVWDDTVDAEDYCSRGRKRTEFPVQDSVKE